MPGAQVSHQLEVNAPASEAWELCSTLKLMKLVEQELKHVIRRIEVVDGDGGVGTLLNTVFLPETGFGACKEKFTKIDEEKRVKETEVVEGGYLDLGFTLYRVRFEIIEKDEASCIIKSSIEYDLKEEAAANASIVSIQSVAKVAEIIRDHLLKNRVNIAFAFDQKVKAIA